MDVKVIDAIGEVCPVPVILATKALQERSGETTLEILVDNAVAVQNLQRMADSRGLKAEVSQTAENRYSVRIPPESGAEAPACETCKPMPAVQLGTVVAVGTNAMGRGDDALGATLLKGYLYALSQQETPPETVLFFNGGAKIPIEGSVSLEDLRALQEHGTEILTCGTCLNYYGLTEKLAIGSVTNMYVIAEKLSQAKKVISL